MRDSDRRRAGRACSAPTGSCSATTPPCAGARVWTSPSRSRAATVPREIEVREGGVRYLAAPWDGQKTGAFLDQRPNRLLAGDPGAPGGRALDCFAYHGSFAHPPGRGRAGSVLALDASRDALSPRRRQRGAQWARQHRVARGRRVRDAPRLRPGARAVRHHRARPAGIRQEPRRGRRRRSGATARSTSGPCAASPRAGSCSPPVARSTSGCPSSSPCSPTPPATAGGASTCAGFWARGRTIPRCSRSPRPSYLKGAVLQARVRPTAPPL